MFFTSAQELKKRIFKNRTTGRFDFLKYIMSNFEKVEINNLFIQIYRINKVCMLLNKRNVAHSLHSQRQTLMKRNSGRSLQIHALTF